MERLSSKFICSSSDIPCNSCKSIQTNFTAKGVKIDVLLSFLIKENRLGVLYKHCINTIYNSLIILVISSRDSLKSSSNDFWFFDVIIC